MIRIGAKQIEVRNRRVSMSAGFLAAQVFVMSFRQVHRRSGHVEPWLQQQHELPVQGPWGWTWPADEVRHPPPPVWLPGCQGLRAHEPPPELVHRTGS